ncbi:MAG: AMP-binding protein [Clostridia bacterium]|nr:AMP-binding protein [Clostridia bacterium]
MTDYHIGSYRSIDDFVRSKLDAFQTGGLTFRTLFTLMFRESDNVLWEKSEGYRIRKTTYGEARTHILSRAAALKTALGDLPHNAVVGLYLDNSLDWIELFWAILAAGFRPLLMNLRLPAPLLLNAMRVADCRAVIAENGAFDCPVLRPGHISPDGDPIGTGPFGTELFVMSSGTTENVKVCAYSAEEFYYQIRDSYGIICEQPQIKKHYEGNLKLLTFLPFYHVFGLIAMYIWFSFFSRTFVQLNDLSPSTIVNTIRRHKVTHVFAVPLFWEKVSEQAKKGIADRGEKTAAKFDRALALWEKLPRPLASAFSKLAFREVRENLFGDSILYMITGGSFLDPAVQLFFNGIGYPLANGYGMTEIGITSVELSDKQKYLRAGSVGKPMQNAEYRIDEKGELLVRGKVTAKYVLSADGLHPRGEWFQTHDLAECVDGHYRILGRADDLIVGPNGENLNPNVIEPLLKTDGAEVCLIPATDNGAPAAVLLLAVNRMTTEENLQRIRAALNERIERANLSSSISRVAAVEGPLMGPDEFKLNRLRLRRDYASGALRPFSVSKAQEAEASDALLLRVRAIVAAAVNRSPDDVAPDADFFLDLGGTSLDYFAMLTKLRDEFDAAFPLEETGLKTARAIADYIRAEKGGSRGV